MTEVDRKCVLKMLSQARLTLIDARAFIRAGKPSTEELVASVELGKAYDSIGSAKRAFGKDKEQEK